MAELNSSITKRERDTAIDFVKFIALFLVINSHMSCCYPKYQFLATGGAIGDVLFFFVSGFTLFLGNGQDHFDEWYKRRLKRIYPSLLAVALIGGLIGGRNDTFTDVILAKRYWFIQCIFVLYPILFLFKKFVSKPIILLVILSIVIMSIYPFIHENQTILWSGGYYRWAVMLLFMLLGAIIGQKRREIRRMNLGLALTLTIICIVVYYGILYLFNQSFLHVISIIPMMGIAIFTYHIGNSKPFDIILHSKFGGPIIISIGALCLESYLIQKLIITSNLNSIFPFNIPIIIFGVLIASYLCKILANVISQVFDSLPLNWKKVFRIY